MIWLYRLILFCASPFILIRLWLRSRKNVAYKSRLIERTGKAPTATKPGGIWVHAVSVGESITATPLIESLLSHYPDREITVTCTTPTASQLITKQFGTRVHHSYLPYDYRYFVNRFLKQMQPSLLIIMETELWPNLLLACQRHGVKTMTANMRISDKSIKRYRYIAPMLKPILRKVNVFSVQSQMDSNRIAELGAPLESITVTGNLKYDAFTDKPLVDTKLIDTLRVDSRTIWCAGSTHQGEDEKILQAMEELSLTHNKLLLVLAPRHPERFEEVYELACAKFSVQRWSSLVNNDTPILEQKTRVLLLDTMGDLKRFIACSDICFVGGSLVDAGGHNILEACHAGIPVLFGPHMQNFKQAKADVIATEAGYQVESVDELTAKSRALLTDATLKSVMGKAGLNLIKKNQGALQRTLILVSNLIN